MKFYIAVEEMRSTVIEVEAENENEALELIDDMQDKDFDWSDFDDGHFGEFAPQQHLFEEYGI